MTQEEVEKAVTKFAHPFLTATPWRLIVWWKCGGERIYTPTDDWYIKLSNGEDDPFPLVCMTAAALAMMSGAAPRRAGWLPSWMCKPRQALLDITRLAPPAPLT